MDMQSYLRPSSAAWWSKCAAYPKLNALLAPEHFEETENEIRDDGIACHWLAQKIWNREPIEVGTLSPNNREITEEMMYAVDEYHAMIRSWDASVLSIETQLPVSKYFPGVSDGTPDVAVLSLDHSTIFIGDLKYGFKPVDVWKNKQLIIYAWTLICYLTERGYAPQTARLFICQPRCAHRDGVTREWQVSVQELAELARELQQQAQACYATNPNATVGNHCYGCAAAFGCQSMQAAAANAIEVSYDATPFVLTDRQLAYELTKLFRAKSHLENRLNSLTTQAESAIRKGKTIPGFELGRKATRDRWRDGSEELLRNIAPLLNVDVMEPAKLKTVAKLRNKLPDDILSMYAEKPVGELVLREIEPDQAIRKFMKR